VSDTEDTIGCWVVAILALGGVWWAYTHYEIRPKAEVPIITPTAPAPTARPASAAPVRPIGLIEAGELDNGDLWRIDADTVTGPRSARQVWVKSDHTQNKAAVSHETVTLYRINCDTSAYRTLALIEYDKRGKALRTFGAKDFSATDDYAPPGSYIQGVVRRTCLPAFDPTEKTSR
jgi:hypothetical protein